jgi:hypothetical protein
MCDCIRRYLCRWVVEACVPMICGASKIANAVIIVCGQRVVVLTRSPARLCVVGVRWISLCGPGIVLQGHLVIENNSSNMMHIELLLVRRAFSK